jgi:hypothetical protein
MIELVGNCDNISTELLERCPLLFGAAPVICDRLPQSLTPTLHRRWLHFIRDLHGRTSGWAMLTDYNRSPYNYSRVLV